MAVRQKEDEQITVSSTAIGITSTLLVDADGNQLNIQHAMFQHLSGGKIQTNAFTTPTGGGTEGSFEREPGDEWMVSGSDDLTSFRMIQGTGESDAIVNVQLYGYP